MYFQGYRRRHTHPRTCTKQSSAVPLGEKDAGMGDEGENLKLQHTQLFQGMIN